MADDNATEKEKLKSDVLEKLEHLKNAAESIRLPEELRKDLVMLLKILLCRLNLGSLDPEDIIDQTCFLEEAIKMNREADIEKVTKELLEEHSRCSSCTIQGDLCVRSTRELRLSKPN